MAYSAPVDTEPASPAVFPGPRRNFVSAIAMIVAGAGIFVMGITQYYFVEAMAWVFLIWGALLFYSDLLDVTLTYTVTGEALVLRSPLRFWGWRRVWPWQHIVQLIVVVERQEATAEDVEIQVYCTPEGSTALAREDMPYDPELARLVAEKAGLKPERGQKMQNFDQIPQDEKGVYTWKK
jgi:hypothetical protein